MGTVSVHQNLSRSGARIVVGTHREAIGTRGANGKNIPRDDRELAIFPQKVSGLANRANNVLALCLGRGRNLNRKNRLPGLIERRTNEVIHGRIHDSKMLFAV